MVKQAGAREIFILEDDPTMAECLALAIKNSALGGAVGIRTFADALAATERLAKRLPDLILLDVLLSGPDGFTFLNELISYQDTAAIPVIIVSSLDLSKEDLASYGVVATLRKDLMTPQDVQAAVSAALANSGGLSLDVK